MSKRVGPAANGYALPLFLGFHSPRVKCQAVAIKQHQRLSPRVALDRVLTATNAANVAEVSSLAEQILTGYVRRARIVFGCTPLGGPRLSPPEIDAMTCQQ